MPPKRKKHRSTQQSRRKSGACSAVDDSMMLAQQLLDTLPPCMRHAIQNEVYEEISATDEGWLWTQIQTSGSRPPGLIEHTMTIVDEKLYVFGGYTKLGLNIQDTADLFELDRTTKIWQRIQGGHGGPESLQGHAAFAFDHCLHIFGGLHHPKRWSNKLYRYTPVSRSWSLMATSGEIPDRRSNMAAAVAGLTFFVFGGYIRDATGCELYNQDVHLLNLTSMTWNKVKAGRGSPPLLENAAAAAVSDHLVMVFGGTVCMPHEKDLTAVNAWGAHEGFSNRWSIFDITANQWDSRTTGEAFQPRDSHSLTATEVGLIMFGGFVGNCNSNLAGVFKPGAGQCWRRLQSCHGGDRGTGKCSLDATLQDNCPNPSAAMVIPARFYHSSAAGSDGLYVYGGTTVNVIAGGTQTYGTQNDFCFDDLWQLVWPGAAACACPVQPASASQEDHTHTTKPRVQKIIPLGQFQDVDDSPHCLEGNRLYANCDFAGAIDKYSESIEQDATAAHFSNRAAAYLALGKTRKALEDGKDAIKKDPGFARGHLRKAVAELNLGFLQDALCTLQEGLKCHPQDIELQQAEEIAFTRMKSPERAISSDLSQLVLEELQKMQSTGEWGDVQSLKTLWYGRSLKQKGEYVAALDIFKTAAEEGLSWGMYEVAIAYRDGLGVAKNHGLFWEWVQKAATQTLHSTDQSTTLYGVACAEHAIALTLLEGSAGVDPDRLTAKNWFQRAADHGLGESQHILGLLAEEEGHFREAQSWYTKVANLGQPPAMLRLANLFLAGKGCKLQPEEAHALLQRAAEMGSLEAAVRLARSAFEGDAPGCTSIHDALLLAESCIAKQRVDWQALADLAEVYLCSQRRVDRERTEVDMTKEIYGLGHGLELQRKLSEIPVTKIAARQEAARAFLQKKRELPASERRAEELFNLAAKHASSALARAALHLKLSELLQLQGRDADAFVHVAAAADLHCPDAMLQLSNMYRDGIGTSFSAKDCETWLRRAVKHGSEAARNSWAIWQEQGFTDIHMQPASRLDEVRARVKQLPEGKRVMELMDLVEKTKGRNETGLVESQLWAEKILKIERLRAYCTKFPESKLAACMLCGLEHFEKSLEHLFVGALEEAVKYLFEAYMQDTLTVSLTYELVEEFVKVTDGILHVNPLHIPATVVSGILKDQTSVDKDYSIAGLTRCIKSAKTVQQTYTSHVPGFYLHRGFCHAFMKKYHLAKRDFQQVQRLCPGDSEIYYHLAACESKCDGRRKLYEKYLSGAARDDRKKSEAHYQLCACAIESGDHAQFRWQLQLAREAEKDRLTFLFGPLTSDNFPMKGMVEHVEQYMSMLPSMKARTPAMKGKFFEIAGRPKFEGCSNCGALPAKLLHCARCKRAFYCGPECQKKHWTKHKESCLVPTR